MPTQLVGICKRKIKQVAEAEQGVVRIPTVLEVAEVPVPVAIRVGVEIRHSVVIVGILPEQCIIRPPLSLKAAKGTLMPLPVFYAEPLLKTVCSIAYNTDLFLFFLKRQLSSVNLSRQTPVDFFCEISIAQNLSRAPD